MNKFIVRVEVYDGGSSPRPVTLLFQDDRATEGIIDEEHLKQYIDGFGFFSYAIREYRAVDENNPIVCFECLTNASNMQICETNLENYYALDMDCHNKLAIGTLVDSTAGDAEHYACCRCGGVKSPHFSTSGRAVAWVQSFIDNH